MLGTIQQYAALNRYGFILSDNDFRSQIFFHIKNYHGSLIPEKGMRVEFDLGPGFKPGLPDQAIKVIPADTAEKAVTGGAK